MPMDTHSSFPRRYGWLLAAFLAPFLMLSLWSVLLIRGTRKANHEIDHCTAWNQEIGRHRDAFEAQHAKAASLLGAANTEIEVASVDAAASTFQRSRETLEQKTHGEPDSALTALDVAAKTYADQMGRVRETALIWFATARGASKDVALSSAREAMAHLEHRRLEVQGAFQALERRHRTRLEEAIFASNQNRVQLSYFATVSLLIALGFATAASIVLWLKDKSELSSRFSQTLIETLPEGLLAWNRNGTVLHANAALGRMTGHSTQALAPGILADRILPVDIRRQIEGIDQGGRLTFNLSHSTGRLLAVEASVGALDSVEGPVHIAVFRDITRSTGAERHLLENQRMAELGHNMASFCRDLQRLFHPVKLSMEMLRRPGGGATDGHTWTQLEHGVEAISDLLAQIVKFANQDLHPEQASTFDMNACMQEVVESFLNHGIALGRLNLDLASIPAMVNGPRERFKSALELLLQRALDVTEEDSTVKVRTWDEDSYNCLEILDSGDAIPSSQINSVFEPVYITSMGAPESGFALFNVASTIQSMGGEIKAEHLEGGWTRFFIQIPQGW
jgi:PAS domain S-box-containing protein